MALVLERSLSLSEAARLPVFRRADGSYPTTQTVARWVRRGVCGVKLESRRVGREWLVTEAACERFSLALANQEGQGR